MMVRSAWEIIFPEESIFFTSYHDALVFRNVRVKAGDKVIAGPLPAYDRANKVDDCWRKFPGLSGLFATRERCNGRGLS